MNNGQRWLVICEKHTKWEAERKTEKKYKKTETSQEGKNFKVTIFNTQRKEITLMKKEQDVIKNIKNE